MSTMTAIGLAHGIFPIVGCMLLKNKWGLGLGTLIGVLIAAFLGSPRYLMMDLIGIAGGMAVGVFSLKDTEDA